MSQTEVQQVFSAYITDGELLSQFSGATVESLEVNRRDSFLRTRIRMTTFLPFETVALLEQALQKGLRLNSVEVLPQYPENSLSVDCFSTVIEFLRRRSVSVNGTFNDATCTATDDGWRISLNSARLDVLLSTHTDRMLRDLITELFGRSITIDFEGVDGVDEQYEALLRQAEEEAAAAACQAPADQLSLDGEDLVREGAKLLGYPRTGSAISALMLEAIRYAQWKGRITLCPNGNYTLTSEP